MGKTCPVLQQLWLDQNSVEPVWSAAWGAKIWAAEKYYGGAPCTLAGRERFGRDGVGESVEIHQPDTPIRE